jgi:hypothetical protein
MKRFLTSLVGVLALSLAVSVHTSHASAQTPVQTFMSSFDDVRGVKVFEAKGAVITFARAHIRKSPLEPLADNVQEVTLMMMKKASDQTIGEFLPALRQTLATYQFYGRKTGMDGRIVEVYGSKIKNGVVDELVIFNSDLNSLFSLRGSFPVADLQALDK